MLTRKEFWKEVWRLAFKKGVDVTVGVGAVLAILLPFASWFDPYRSDHEKFWAIFDKYAFGWISIAIFWFFVVKNFFQSTYLVYSAETASRDARIQVVEGELTDIKTQRPRFRYNPEKSRIDSGIVEWGDKFFGQVYLGLTYTNKGAGTAHRVKVSVYYCWLNDVENIVDQSSDEGQSTWETGDSTNVQIHATQPAKIMSVPNTAPQWIFDEEGFVAFLEFQYRANADDGSPYKDEYWIHWNPNPLFHNGLGSCTREMIDRVKPCIDSFKQKQLVTPPLPALGTEEPQESATSEAYPETKTDFSDC